MDDVSTDKLLDELRSIFATWEISSQIITDNGPQFTSQRFEQFFRANNCKHTRTSPYHTATNDIAECFVQSLKQALQASRKEAKSHSKRIASFLIHYRNARHSTTKVSPAQLLMKRDLRSILHLMRPDVLDNVFKKQTAQVNSWSAAVERDFAVGDPLMVRDYRPSPSGNLQWYTPKKDPSPTK